MADETYNDWTNYPTWCVNLWLLNDEGLYNLVRERVHEAIEAAPENPDVSETLTEREVAVFELERWLENELCAADSDYGLIPELEGFPADLLGWALSSVNFFEIAEQWIDAESETS